MSHWNPHEIYTGENKFGGSFILDLIWQVLVEQENSCIWYLIYKKVGPDENGRNRLGQVMLFFLLLFLILGKMTALVRTACFVHCKTSPFDKLNRFKL